jgi:TfoX/Sxy family transcriptional regulator of competence genes
LLEENRHVDGLRLPPPGLPLCDYACVAYDEGLAARLLDILADEAGLAEKKMFGGLAVLLDGNMAVGVYGNDLLVRTDPGHQETLLAEPGTRPFDMTSRPMKGWIVVDARMCAEDDDLRRWVSRGVAHARSLPPK